MQKKILLIPVLLSFFSIQVFANVAGVQCSQSQKNPSDPWVTYSLSPNQGENTYSLVSEVYSTRKSDGKKPFSPLF